MYVRRLRLFGVAPFNCNIPENGGELPQATRKRMLLQGGNGSGKTTILNTIRTLWQYFGEWLDRGNGKAIPAKQAKDSLAHARCAAMEIVGFPTPETSLWIGMAGGIEWAELRRQFPNSLFAGAVGQGLTAAEAITELPMGDWKDRRARSMVGSEPLPNIVHIPPDMRTLKAARVSNGAALLDLTPLNWCAVFDPRRSLDKLLLTVKALRPESFDETLSLVNMAVGHANKKITGFNEAGRLEVAGVGERDTPYKHTVKQFSSGERQMLLLTAYAVALLRPGGILIVDEPDLHIHMAMVTQLVQTLDYVCQKRGCQLIVASHSELVWDFFGREEEKIEFGRWRGTPS